MRRSNGRVWVGVGAVTALLLLAGSLIPGQLTQAMLAAPGDTVAAATLAAAQLGEELRLADVVDLAANVQAVLGGGGEPGGGTELWLSYKGGVGPQLSMEPCGLARGSGRAVISRNRPLRQGSGQD